MLDEYLNKIYLRYMGLTFVPQFISTVSEIMTYMANFAGGTVPDETSEEFAQWLTYIQTKYEEASKRGFWRRLLTKDTLSLTEGDEEVLLPVRFQRPNSLYVLLIAGTNPDEFIDLADPDRIPDDQAIYIEMVNEPTIDADPDPILNPNFGRWRLTFKEPIETTQDATIWYFATPPKPTTSSDEVLLPGDMIAYGALSEYFRAINLEGSQDDARTEYENRLNGYLALEMVPPRHELLRFVSNPRRIDRTAVGRSRFSVRSDRYSRL